MESLNPQQLQEVTDLVTEHTGIWEPLPGPQSDAYYSPADILFYGGSAGGGKSDLILGLSATQHTESIIYRREATQLVGLIQRMTSILGSRDGYNGQDKIWNFTTDIERRLEFGSCKTAGDEIKYQGRPHSLKAFDEITHFLESQFRFLMGWKRTVNEHERQRVVCTGNPPTDSDGEWVIKYWGPWLDPKHPNPAEPGELRWYVTFKNGQEHEVSDGTPIPDPSDGGEMVQPLSRTFIPSDVEDNPFLMETGYKATLQALPEPLRSQMLDGDFTAGIDDDPWQVLPTEWVEAAMQRWIPKHEFNAGEMDSMGVDVARGGRDNTVIATRYGGWFDELQIHPGQSTPNGQAVASLAVMNLRDAAPVHVDVIGVGASAYDHLVENNIQAVAVNNSEGSSYVDRSGKLKMVNKRAEIYWQLREALDPRSDSYIALPDDSELKADLCAPRWKLTARGVQIESKEDLIKRIGRSPDRADAVTLANIVTPKALDFEEDYEPPRDVNPVTGY